MKRLLTYTDASKMPVWQEDLSFLQDITFEMISGLCKTFALGRSSYIVVGCEVTGESLTKTVSAGIVVVVGEVLFCPSQQVTGSGDLYFTRQALSPASGSKQFVLSDGNSETRLVYDANYAKVHIGDGQGLPAGTLFVESDSMLDALKTAILPQIAWGNLALLNGYTTTSIAKFKKSGDIISLRGEVFNDNLQCGGEFAVLPSSCRPSSDIEVGDILIRANGQIKDVSCSTRKVIDCIYMI